MSEKDENPIQTPEFEVGAVYSEDYDWNSQNFWQLHQRSLAAKADRKKKGRVLRFGSVNEANRAFQKKMKSSMKWHPADMARQAQREIARIDPGLGYKIEVVVDNTVSPPPLPKTPELSPLKSLNSVLMQGALKQAKQPIETPAKTPAKKAGKNSAGKKKAGKKKAGKKDVDLDGKENKNECKKEATTVSSRRLLAPCCFGCNLITCLNSTTMATAVATANSMKESREVKMMNIEERIEWFINLYREISPKGSTVCAVRYANRQMAYVTPEYTEAADKRYQELVASVQNAANGEEDSEVSSKFQRELQAEEMWEEEQLSLAELAKKQKDLQQK